jgi:hypothetical protein
MGLSSGNPNLPPPELLGTLLKLNLPTGGLEANEPIIDCSEYILVNCSSVIMIFISNKYFIKQKTPPVIDGVK